jgi:hypothetical protein
MSTKTLHDGRMVDSSSVDWYRESLATTVLDLPTLAERQTFLATYEKNKGAEAAERLRDVMQGVFNARAKARKS